METPWNLYIAMSGILVIVPAVLVCIPNWKVQASGAILAGIALAYLISLLPPLK